MIDFGAQPHAWHQDSSTVLEPTMVGDRLRVTDLEDPAPGLARSVSRAEVRVLPQRTGGACCES